MRTVYLSFSAEINVQTTEALIATLANLVTKKVEHVYILLSTPGGSVMNGLNLFNVMRGLPLKITTHNVGNVNSIGTAVFLAGEERYACPHSTFMFHGVGYDVKGQVRLEEKLLRERLDSLLADQRRIGDIIRERTSLSQDDTEGLFREAQTKDATFAASCGIVNEVRDVEVPSGSSVVALAFQR